MAEMIAGQYGIGYYTWESYTLQSYADIVVGMLLIGALGMGSSALVRRAGLAADAVVPGRRRAMSTPMVHGRIESTGRSTCGR